MKKTLMIEHMRDIVRYWKKQDLSVGLVPTMGKVTEDHEALIRHALKQNDRVVVSMFANPLQFSSAEEYEKHETAFEEGEEVCRRLGVHHIFQPKAEEMYGGRYCTFVVCEEWPKKEEDADGYNYYKGCCTVVTKLYHIIQPERIYIRPQKSLDAQVFRMLAHDLNMDVEIYTE